MVKMLMKHPMTRMTMLSCNEMSKAKSNLVICSAHTVQGQYLWQDLQINFPCSDRQVGPWLPGVLRPLMLLASLWLRFVPKMVANGSCAWLACCL